MKVSLEEKRRKKDLFYAWFSHTNHDIFLTSIENSYPLEYEIIQYRYRLNERPFLTLEETGIIFNITHEGIEQIEQRALKNLSDWQYTL